METAQSLTEATKKDQPDHVVWTDYLQSYFVSLKEALTSCPIQAGLNFSQPFIPDASNVGIRVGIGAVYSQATQTDGDRSMHFPPPPPP